MMLRTVVGSLLGGLVLSGAVMADTVQIGLRTTAPATLAHVPDVTFSVQALPLTSSPSAAYVEFRLMAGEHWVAVQAGRFEVSQPNYQVIRVAWAQHCGGTATEDSQEIGTATLGTLVKLLSVTETPTGVTLEVQWVERSDGQTHTEFVTAPLAWSGTSAFHAVSVLPTPAEPFRAGTTLSFFPHGTGWLWYPVPPGTGYWWNGNGMNWAVWK